MIHCTRTLLAVAALGALASGCSSESKVTWLDSGVPYHQNGEGISWNYQFVYHPNAQVYFEPHSKTYFWFENNAWQSGAELPREVTPLDDRLARVVHVRELEPMLQHDSVIAMNPPTSFTWHPDFDARLESYGDAQYAEVGNEVIEAND